MREQLKKNVRRKMEHPKIELFLNEEEEKMYQLQKLEKRFILSEEDMLWELEKKKLNVLDDFNTENESFRNYKRHLHKSSSKRGSTGG